ncbi:DUF1501 domain-containing protein [Micromonospora musae]|uniref:DUF1501 domain-containing protein n=1 Tax=Micromonospora musae TaxID=1894970 RepID=A0ABX9RG15_9ACTN|nr:DUF1501 domain-containing protein [Micromonospora musae]RKN22074.1 DUF1501 domain-containing protein [Micromonospora musae]
MSSSFVVIHLAGGNDALNTVVPFTDPHYIAVRPTLALQPDSELPTLRRPGREDVPGGSGVLPINDSLGLHGALTGFRDLYEQGRLAVLLGVGYPERDRSHFRSLDVWHTAEPHQVRSDGWLGRVASVLDPQHDNPVLLTNIGRSMPLALAAPGVMAASLESIGGYGLLSPADRRGGGAGGVAHADLAALAASLYQGRALPNPWGSAQQVGVSAIRGIRSFDAVPDRGETDVQYPPFNPIAARLEIIARIATAGVGAQIFHTTHDGYDTHENQFATQHRLLADLSEAVTVFLDDLAQRDPLDRTLILIHSEFGRRIAESRGGTDHGGAGVAFLVGNGVAGGIYGDMPSLRREDSIDGDLRPSLDLREVYTAILQRFLNVDAAAVLGKALGSLRLDRTVA